MPDKKRVRLELNVDLDDVPGEFHSPEQAAAAITKILSDRIPHYRPHAFYDPRQ